MRDFEIPTRCMNLTNQSNNNPELKELIDGTMGDVYSKCANCNMRFYHMMMCIDDLLVNFGDKYDTRGRKIIKLLEIMFNNCEVLKRKKFFGGFKIWRTP